MTQSSRPPGPPPPPPPPLPLPPPPPPPSSSPQGKSESSSQQVRQTSSQTMPMAPKISQKPPDDETRPSLTNSNQTAPYANKGSGSRVSIPSAGPTPGSPTLAQLVREAYEAEYSDLHLGVNEIPRMRDRGEIIMTDYPLTDRQTFMSWLNEILSPEDIQQFSKNLEYDGAAQYDFVRVRVNIFDSLRGPGMVLRLIPTKILTLEQLRLPPIFKHISDSHKGLVLVTGPTGSGKSTTMAAMVDYVNTEHPKHIITIEDPIEFVHQSRRAIIRHREVGIHTLKFDNALKAALREDPDLILVGEMRDKETVNTALKAAQTGHLVMGTLHTNSAVKTIERILNLYTAEEQDAMRIALAESLVAIIAQGLCRTTDGKRAAYHDILVNTDSIKDYIRQGKYEEIIALMQDGEYDGMITMNKSLFNLYQEGRITEETALEMSPTPNEIAMMLRGRV